MGVKMIIDVDIVELAEALPWCDTKITSVHLAVLGALISLVRAYQEDS